MEARPFRGGDMDPMPRDGGTRDGAHTPHPHRQMRTFQNMVQRAEQAMEDHGAKN